MIEIEASSYRELREKLIAQGLYSAKGTFKRRGSLMIFTIYK